MALQKNNRNFWAQVWRYLHFKLIIPIKRSHLPPEYSARGVAVGLFWGLTPTVGIQMPLCFITWFLFKKFESFKFSLVLALAWTWVSNFFTVIPMYYCFFITGQLLTGNWNNILGYKMFSMIFKTPYAEKSSTEVNIFETGIFMFEEFGIAMILGSIPYAIIGGFLGYFISYQFILSRNLKRRPNPN